MPYSIDRNPAGRFTVTSPKGKIWKKTFASLEAAQKGVEYIEGRYGGRGSSATIPAPSSSPAPENSPDTKEERLALGIPEKPGESDDTEGW